MCPSGFICPTCFLNKYAVLFYSRFILFLSLFHTDHLVSIFLFNYDYLKSTTTLLCLCFYSIYYHFVNMNFICNNNNNLYILLSFHFAYGTDEEIRDFEIYLSIISNDVILILLFLPFTSSNGIEKVFKEKRRNASCLKCGFLMFSI